MASSLIEVLKKFAEKLPGCLHTSIVDRSSGLALAAISEGDPLRGAGADAFHSDLYRLSGDLIESGGPEAAGIVLTSREGTFVSQPLGDSGFVWLVITERATTVGFTQAIMRKWHEEIQEGLQALV